MRVGPYSKKCWGLFPFPLSPIVRTHSLQEKRDLIEIISATSIRMPHLRHCQEDHPAFEPVSLVTAVHTDFLGTPICIASHLRRVSNLFTCFWHHPTRNRNVLNTSYLFSEALVRMQTLEGRDVFVFLFYSLLYLQWIRKQGFIFLFLNSLH